jgi:hypothetical protein
VTLVEATCPHCHADLRFERFHTGFNNTGYAYCDVDGSLLVWGSYDPRYVAIVGEQHPWMLDAAGRASVEAHLARCPCGGRFGMANPPRCPRCTEPIRELLSDSIYFADFGDCLDPERDDLWV